MLPKYCRLSLKQIRFQEVAFKRIENPLFRLYLLKTIDSRGAIVVSKKQLLKSSERNLVKRRISTGLVEILKSLPEISIVVWVNKKCLNASQPEIKTALENSLQNFLTRTGLKTDKC